MMDFISSLLIVLLIVFWIWMFREMMQDETISPNTRVYWIIGFVFLNILTAGYYFFAVYTKE